MDSQLYAVLIIYRDTGLLIIPTCMDSQLYSVLDHYRDSDLLIVPMGRQCHWNTDLHRLSFFPSKCTS